MDKSKPSGFGAHPIGTKRGQKKVSAPMMDSLVALGSGSGSSSAAISSNTASKVLGKRDPGPLASPIASKKPKLSSSRRSSTSEQWIDAAIDVETHEILQRIISAEEAGNDDKVDSLICGSVRLLKSTRTKSEPLLYLSLLYLSKTRPHLFNNDLIAEAFCSLLRKDAAVNYKVKINITTAVVAANLLLAVYREDANWPKCFVKVYVEDALNERFWVDSPDCKTFVDNIVTAFGTKIPPKSMMQQDVLLSANPSLKGESPASSSPSHPPQASEEVRDEDSSGHLFASDLKERLEEEIGVLPRFSANQKFVVEYTTEVVNEQLVRRQVPSEISRNVLKLLVATVGIQQIRLLVAQRLEIWLQNPKLTRPAQDLLLGVCLNCNELDVEVIAVLVKMRLKTKPLVNHFVFCIKELLNQRDENLPVVLRQVVLNEISPTRGGNNMQLIMTLFQYSPEKATKALATLFQELLLKDDNLKLLRGLLREIVRTLRHDHLNMTLFVATLVDENPEFLKIDVQDSATRDRVFTSIVDLITLCMFVSVSPSIKEAGLTTSKTDRKDILRSFQVQIAEMQRLGVYWVHKVVLKIFRPERNEFVHGVQKMLIMEDAVHYYSKDNWPPENDRNFMFKLCSDVPVLEDTLIRLLNMGLSKSFPLSCQEAIEACDALTKRAAAIYDGDHSSYPVLKIQNEEIFQLMFKSSIYRFPENIALPPGYEAPEMAISDWYWKVWIQLLTIVAHNPEKFGAKAWQDYPTLNLLIEMAITNHFEFPPPTRQNEDFKSRELQISSIEKQQILQFETHLAAASTKIQITESNSLLLSKLISYDPTGTARKPPSQMLELLKMYNSSMKLGHLLCQSRNPDFLLEIIQRQQKQKSPNQVAAPISMPWLNDLVEMHEENYSVLPVQCLCEFLLGQIHDEEQLAQQADTAHKHSERVKRKEKKRKQMKLVLHHQNILATNESLSRDLIEYFMKRLSFQQSAFRQLASKAMGLLFKDVGTEDEFTLCSDNNIDEWLLQRLPKAAHFESIKDIVCEGLRLAIVVETSPPEVNSYVQFLVNFADPSDAGIVMSLSNLLIDRAVITRHLVQDPMKETFLDSSAKLFHSYLKTVKKPSDHSHPWSDSQDKVLVRWENGESAVLNIMVVHAMIILLTYGPNTKSQKLYDELMNTWFGDPPPQSFLLDTSEEALLVPDWLKMKLIRSPSARLAEAALLDLEPHQLVLFIQSFGLPVPSMEKLLVALDECCDSNEELLMASIPDKKFMRHLVEVQWMRGVKAGHRFADMLGTEDDAPVTTKKLAKLEQTPKPAVVIGGSLSDWLLNPEKNSLYLTHKNREIGKEIQNLKAKTKSVTEKFLREITTILKGKNDEKKKQLVSLIKRNALNSSLTLIATLASGGRYESVLNLLKKVNTAINTIDELQAVPIIRVMERMLGETEFESDMEPKVSTEAPVARREDIIRSITSARTLETYQMSSPELKNSEDLIFSSESQSYLLPLLVHKTRFETLNTYVSKLLVARSASGVSLYKPTSVLDFLSACLDSPRIWAGRDRRRPKHSVHEDVLKLSDDQVQRLVDYILEEKRCESRVCLLLKSVCYKKSHVNAIVSRLKTLIESEKGHDPDKSASALDLLSQLQLQMPSELPLEEQSRRPAKWPSKSGVGGKSRASEEEPVSKSAASASGPSTAGSARAAQPHHFRRAYNR